MIPKPGLFQQTGYSSPKVSWEPLVAVPMYIDAREPKKLQTFLEISRNHAKTAIPAQKSRINRASTKSSAEPPRLSAASWPSYRTSESLIDSKLDAKEARRKGHFLPAWYVAHFRYNRNCKSPPSNFHNQVLTGPAKLSNLPQETCWGLMGKTKTQYAILS